MRDYPIEYNLNEKDRLDEQVKLLKDPTLAKLGASSKECLEIGCGVGSNISTVRKLNSELKFTGIDICPASIKSAKNEFEDEKTSFICGTVEDFNPAIKYDLIILRLILWSTSSRKDILNKAYSLLKDNGQIYIYEPDDQLLITYPRKNAFMNIIESWQKAVLEKGLDPFVGRKLVSLAT